MNNDEHFDWFNYHFSRDTLESIYHKLENLDEKRIIGNTLLTKFNNRKIKILNQLQIRKSQTVNVTKNSDPYK